MEWLLTVGQYALAITAIIALVVTLFKYFIIKPLTRLIDERTAPIQKNANGGQSLADVNKKVDKLVERLQNMETQRNARLDVLEAGHREILEILTAPKPRTKKVENGK